MVKLTIYGWQLLIAREGQVGIKLFLFKLEERDMGENIIYCITRIITLHLGL